VTQQFLKFLPTVAIMLVFLVVMGRPISWDWLLLIPLFALFFVFNCGLALITARLCVHWRDLNNFLPFLTRFFFYTTGIFFSIEERFGPQPATATSEATDGYPWLVSITNYQPIHEFLSIARAALLQGPGYGINSMYWLYATLWTIAIFIFGVWFFWRAEERYGRVD
jgi:teichoic acid transport system permease protein